MSGRMPVADHRPLIIPVVYRFDTGGRDNGVGNLIDHMPAGAYRHAVVALTAVVHEFARRVRRDAIRLVSLHRPPGQNARSHPRLVQLFGEFAAAIVHVHNLGPLEA
jgi:hypothetical protein